jgi:diketogulonate reductase-like aldo/keto reductase
VSLIERGKDVQRRDFVGTLAAMSSIPWPSAPFQERVAMATRPIPRTGEVIPVIGLGTWQTFDPPAADVAALDKLAEVLRVFFAAGGRVIDSSPMYGRAEEVTGTLLERLGATQSTFLATKIWTDGRANGERQLEASCRLLRRKSLELEQVHNLVDWKTQLDLLRRKKAEGRVKYIGVTHYTEASFGELETIVRREQLDFVQLPYSIGFRGAEARLLPAAAASGTAVLVNMPFEGGSLFAQARGKPLPDWTAPFGASWAQLFLKFILANPAVTCVIPATANPAHMLDDVAAGTGPLPDADQRARLLRLLGV